VILVSIIPKVVLRKLLEYQVIERTPGRIRFKFNGPEFIYNQLEPYDKYFKVAILLLDGIDKVEFNYIIGTLCILYDIKRIDEDKVLKWINKIIEIGVENQEVIEEYSNTDIEYLENLLEKQLKEEIERL
jgi:hypothetical protein